MLSTSLIKQLIAVQQLQACSTAAPAVAAAAVAAFGHTRQCGIQTTAGQAADAVANAHDPTTAPHSGSHTQWAAEQQQHGGREAWSPARSLPPPSTYGLKITIKAHDLLFVKLASTAIRDLVMVNMAPKSREVLPDPWRNDGVGVPWVNLVSTAAAAGSCDGCGFELSEHTGLLTRRLCPGVISIPSWVILVSW